VNVVQQSLHEAGDGCAIYVRGYEVVTDDMGEVPVEDVSPGDLYRDPSTDDDNEWFQVDEVVIVGDDVHIDASPAEDDEECE
jgi:hypothetical protein